MKKIIQRCIGLLLMFLATALTAQQVPQGFNYQAVIRNSDNSVVSNKPVKLIFEIIDGSPSNGSVVYTELHSGLSTNDYGLVNIVVGQGSALSGPFSSINWGGGPKFMRISANINNSGSYITLGGIGASTQLMSVPFALAAGNAGGSNVTINQGNGISVTNSGNGTYTITNSGDTNPNDDVTTNSVANGDVSGPFSDLQIKAAAVGTQELANSAVTAAKLNTMGAASGQVLKFQNGAWAPGDVTAGGGIYTGGTGITIQNNQINSEWVRSANNSNAIYTANGLANVGIGTNTPQTKLHVHMDNFNSNSNSVILAEYTGVSQDTIAAVRGVALYSGIGGAFSSPNLGLKGEATDFGIGVLGASQSGTGVYGEGLTGVYGEGLTGIHGRCDYIGGEAVFGQAVSGTGVRAHSTYGTALEVMSANGSAARFNQGNVNVRAGNVYVEGSINKTNFDGANRSGLNINIADGGVVNTSGAGGQTTFTVSTLVNNIDNGYAAVAKNSTFKSGMYVDANGKGVIFGDIKNFRMPHPTQPGKEIWYASVEGPEAAAYMRGTGDLVNGEAIVTFSDDYQIVANPTTMTVILTPLDAASKGMAVVEKTATGFKVKELMQGAGSYAFDWEVKCVRKGYESYRVIRDEDEAQPSPVARETNSATPALQGQLPAQPVSEKH